MEENILGLFLAGEELHVIDDQQIDRAVHVRELINTVVLDRIDEFYSKPVRRGIEHSRTRILLNDQIADSLDQVGLAQTNITVDHERVIACATRIIRYGNTRRARKLIGLASDD